MTEEAGAISLLLTQPEGTPDAPLPVWRLVAYNKRALAAWVALCRDTPASARSYYCWLSQHATRVKPCRCYPLKGKCYAGIWCYEAGSGERVYYKPNDGSKLATIYYAGAHPLRIPSPPDSI